MGQAQPAHFADGGIFDQIYKPGHELKMAQADGFAFKRPSVIPGFGAALG
jgi:hypothetical protein